jgi:putative transposase
MGAVKVRGNRCHGLKSASPRKRSGFVSTLCVVGEKMDASSRCLRHTTSDCSISVLSNPKQLQNQEGKLRTFASRQHHKMTTCGIKYAFCRSAYQITNCCTRLVPDSPSKKGKSFYPYWTESCLELSKKWLSLTETASVGSDLKSSNTLHPKTIAKSWFSTRISSPQNKSLQEIFLPSLPASPQDSTVCDGTVIRSRKIRVYPRTLQDKQRIDTLCSTERAWFNETIEYLRVPGTKADNYAIEKLFSEDSTFPTAMRESPSRIRRYAVEQATIAVQNAKKKFREIKKFQHVRFRSKRNPKQGFSFDSSSLSLNKEGLQLYKNKKTRDFVEYERTRYAAKKSANCVSHKCR